LFAAIWRSMVVSGRRAIMLPLLGFMGATGLSAFDHQQFVVHDAPWV